MNAISPTLIQVRDASNTHGRMSKPYWDTCYTSLDDKKYEKLAEYLDLGHLHMEHFLEDPSRCRWLYLWLGLEDGLDPAIIKTLAEFLCSIWDHPYFYPFLDVHESSKKICLERFFGNCLTKCILRLSSTKPGSLSMSYWKKDGVKHCRLHVNNKGKLFIPTIGTCSPKDKNFDQILKYVATRMSESKEPADFHVYIPL